MSKETENTESGVSQRPSPDERIDSADGTFDLSAGPSSGERISGSAGLPNREDVPQETLDGIEADRKERLDPANRPENSEIDNTGREFDTAANQFTDDPDYDGVVGADPSADEEQPVSDLESPTPYEGSAAPEGDNPVTKDA